MESPVRHRDSQYANHFKIPAVTKALESGHGMRFELEWSPTPGKKPEMQIVTYAPPSYIGCVSSLLCVWQARETAAQETAADVHAHSHLSLLQSSHTAAASASIAVPPLC